MTKRGDGRLADHVQLSRELALLLPLLTVALVAVALVAASRSARHQDSDDESTLHDLSAGSLEETGHLLRPDRVDPPKLTVKPLRFARTGPRYGADARPHTQVASLTVPTRRSGHDGEPSSQARDDSAKGTVLDGSGMTKSSTRHRSTSPARTLAPEEEAVLVSVRALLSAMQATSTPSPASSTDPDPGNLTTEDAVEDEEIGYDESTERLMEGVNLQEEEDFRKTHEEPSVDSQRLMLPNRLPSRH